MTKTSLTNRAYPEGDEEANELSGLSTIVLSMLLQYESSSDGV